MTGTELSALEPATVYQVSVSGVNSHGEGTASAPETVLTLVPEGSCNEPLSCNNELHVTTLMQIMYMYNLFYNIYVYTCIYMYMYVLCSLIPRLRPPQEKIPRMIFDFPAFLLSGSKVIRGIIAGGGRSLGTRLYYILCIYMYQQYQ